MAATSVEIISSGNGGSIIYREDDQALNFSWEFAMPPAIALIFGPSPRAWDKSAPWAIGRCKEVYATVGTEVVRQQAPGGSFTIDFDNGIIEILTISR